MFKKRFLLFSVLALSLILPAYVSAATLWNQTLSANLTALPNVQDSPSSDMNIYFADDFTIADPFWNITTIYIPGAYLSQPTPGGLSTAGSLNWAIYANNAGVPAANPEAGSPVVPLISLAYNNSQVTLDGANVTLTLSTPVQLTTGTYWLVFYPVQDYETYGTWGRQTSDTTNGAVAQFIVPGGGGGGPTAWASAKTSVFWPATPASRQDLAFRIEGTAGAPNISVFPTTVNFGTLLLDSSDVTQTVTITNTGTANLNVTGISTTGANFAASGGSCTTPPFSLSQGTSCTKIVQFTPATLGVNSGNLQIISDAPIVTTNIALTATVGAPGISVTPSALTFGNIAVGQTSVYQTVTITNTGAFPLNITSDITGSSDTMFAIATGGTCTFPNDTLAAPEVCTLRVTFTPTANGLQTAILEIVSTDPVSPTVQVALSGTGVYEATPSALEGTYGSEITYGGAPGGFGDKKGKIYIASNKEKVDSWGNTQVAMIFNKFKDMAIDTPYDVSIQWKPKGSKTTNTVDLPGAFTLRKPSLPLTNTYSGAPNTEFTITATDGKWFGTKKGKVYIGGEKCKVKEWTMNPTTGASSVTFVISKKLGAGTYALELENKIGRAVSAGFRVTGP